MAKNAIKGITIKLGGDSVGLEKALAGVNKTSAALNAELRQVNNSLKFDPTNTTLLSQKQELLAQQVKNTSEKLRELKNAQSQVEEQYKSGKIGEDAYRAFQREIVNTESYLRKLEEEEQNVGKASEGAAEETERFKGALEAVNLSSDLFVSAAGAIVTGLVSVAAEAINAGKAYVDMVDEVGKAGDAIDKNSQKAGMSAEAYQEWGYVLQRNGASADGLSGWMKKLNNNVDDAAAGTESAINKFNRLGISVDDLQSKSREEVFADVIAGLQSMENESERAAVLNDLLGGSATELGALLNQTAADTNELRENAHKLGLVMSNEGVSDSAAYADALLDLQSSFTGVKNKIAGDVLPSFTQVIKGMTGIVIGTEGAEKSIENGVETIVKKITSIAPNAGETAAKIAASVANEIPAFVELSTSVTDSFASALTSNAPALAKSAGAIVQSLAAGFAANSQTILWAVTRIADEALKALPGILPSLMSSAGSFAGSIVGFLTRSVTIATQRFPDILKALLSGAGKELPKLVSLLVSSTVTIAQALVENAPAVVDVLAQALPDIISGLLTAALSQLPILIQGLTSIVGSVTASMPQIISALIDAVPQIITAVVTAVGAFTPEIVNAGFDLFTALVAALPQIIDVIVADMPEMIEAIVGVLIDSIPVLAECGVELMTGLVQNLPKIIKGITDAVPRIITSIVGAVEELHGDLVEAGSEALLKLVDKCPDVIRIAKQKTGEIVQGISDAIYAKHGDLIDAGYNLITGMWQGIENAKDWIIEKIGGFTDDVVNAFKDFFDIHSPSHRIESEVGEYNGEAIGTGTIKALPKVKRMIKDAADDLIGSGTFNIPLLYENDERLRSYTPSVAAASASPAPVFNFTMQIDHFENSYGTAVSDLMERFSSEAYDLILRTKLAG